MNGQHWKKEGNKLICVKFGRWLMHILTYKLSLIDLKYIFTTTNNILILIKFGRVSDSKYKYSIQAIKHDVTQGSHLGPL